MMNAFMIKLLFQQEVRRAEEVARDFLKNTSEKFGKPLSKRFRDKINSVKDDHVKRLRAEGKSDDWRVPRSKFLEEKEAEIEKNLLDKVNAGYSFNQIIEESPVRDEMLKAKDEMEKKSQELAKKAKDKKSQELEKENKVKDLGNKNVGSSPQNEKKGRDSRKETQKKSLDLDRKKEIEEEEK